ncbi:probable polygalacturonase At2g43860 [Zingiber officinale]|uniref:probable polygalacturonase At2g43860 n=1 Tax=Zingiber officinale TaxID=94328 RepID=UPI001C4CF779|nr:probable polygalacturonase At2g43860 [Zingiber officinale]
MAGQSVIVISLFVLLLLASSSAATEVLADASIYNVLDFGAKGDGNTNDTLAFVNAWNAACHKSTTPSTLLIPAGKTFLLSYIEFEGPCNNFIYVTQCPEDGPNSLHMLSCTDAQIWGLRSINSVMMHISVGRSKRVDIRDITIVAPDESPNTDGIHVQQSQFVSIRNSGGSGFARNISFEDITMNDVRYPIIIDQYYCPHRKCDAHASAVEVRDVKYIGVRGSSSREVAIALNCSQSVPCSGIFMDSVNLWNSNEGEEVRSNCISANGYAKNQVTPAVSCLTQRNLAS